MSTVASSAPTTSNQASNLLIFWSSSYSDQKDLVGFSRASPTRFEHHTHALVINTIFVSTITILPLSVSSSNFQLPTNFFVGGCALFWFDRLVLAGSVPWKRWKWLVPCFTKDLRVKVDSKKRNKRPYSKISQSDRSILCLRCVHSPQLGRNNGRNKAKCH